VSKDKQASSQAAWALITEGVTAARLEAHRLQHLINRGLKLIEDSEHREHFYQLAGDLIVAAPKRLARLEQDLDRTALALSKMGETYLSARLPLEDKTLVEEAVDSASFGGGRRKSTPVERVAARWLEQQAEAG
jgi:hypothetical protein